MFDNGRIQLNRKNTSSVSENVRLLIAGDFCPVGNTEELFVNGAGEAVAAEFRQVTAQADFSLVNLEAPVTGSQTPIVKTGPNLKVRPDCAELIRLFGFDAAALANNHIGDYGPAAVMETCHVLNRQGTACVGAGKNLAAARRPLQVQVKGRCLAVFNFAENEFGGATADRAGAATIDPLENLPEIAAAADSSDIVLVIVHGGNEFYPLPSPRMRKTYRSFIDAGASAVIGTHTHCPQGVEIWHGAPIIYSLGNFLFDRVFADAAYDAADFWWTGCSVMLECGGDGIGALEIIPHTFGPDASRVRLLSGPAHSLFFDYLCRISAYINDEDVMHKSWLAWCSQRGEELLPYLAALKFPPVSEPEKWNAMVVRNTYTCEAHHEVMSTFFRLLENDSLEQAAGYRRQLQEISSMPAQLAALLKAEHGGIG